MAPPCHTHTPLCIPSGTNSPLRRPQRHLPTPSYGTPATPAHPCSNPHPDDPGSPLRQPPVALVHSADTHSDTNPRPRHPRQRLLAPSALPITPNSSLGSPNGTRSPLQHPQQHRPTQATPRDDTGTPPFPAPPAAPARPFSTPSGTDLPPTPPGGTDPPPSTPGSTSTPRPGREP